MAKSSVVLVCFILDKSHFDLLMGKTENPHVHDFEVFGRVPEPQHQYYFSLETPGCLTKTKKVPKHV